MPKKATRKTTRGKAKAKRTTTTAKRATAAKRASKTTARKATTRRAATKRATTKKPARGSTAKKAVSRSASPIKDAYTKSRILGQIADETGLKKAEVKEVFESLNNLMHRHLKKGGAGEFNMPGLLKCRRIHKKATKARKGINPFTGEETVFKAKPARSVVKVRPLKGLKEMVA